MPTSIFIHYLSVSGLSSLSLTKYSTDADLKLGKEQRQGRYRLWTQDWRKPMGKTLSSKACPFTELILLEVPEISLVIDLQVKEKGLFFSQRKVWL